MRIDVAMEAMPRPEIHEVSFPSLKKYAAGIDWDVSTLYLNIDPYPCLSQSEWEEMDRKRDCTVDLAGSIFRNVVINKSNEASHAMACAWTFSRVETDLVFHFEDDWELISTVDVGGIERLFDRHEWLHQVTIRGSRMRMTIYRNAWFSLAPSFIRGDTMRALGPWFIKGQDPEMQLRKRRDFPSGVPRTWEMRTFDFKIVRPRSAIAVRDIGREWIANSKFAKSNLLPEDHPRHSDDMSAAWVFK